MLKATLILVALLAAMPMAQGFWQDLFPQRVDSLWKDTAGTHAPRGGYRLAVSVTSPYRVFMANGKKLLKYNTSTGWTVFDPGDSAQAFPFLEPAPLAISRFPQDSLVLWGNWRSRSYGARWEALPFPSSRFLVYSIGRDESGRGGLCLGGGIGETIARSIDSGRTWSTVHQGGASGYVRHLHIGDSGWAFAALHPERILFSKDWGRTWSPWPSPPSSGGTPRRIQAMTVTGIPYSPEGLVLWTLHLDTVSGKSILVRNLSKAGRSDTLTNLPDDLNVASLSSDSRSVIVGGGPRLYQSQDAGTGWRMLSVNWLTSAESLIELHGSGTEFATFAWTGKSVYMRYYETGIRPEKSAPYRMRQSRTSASILFSPSFSPAWFRTDGRQLP